MEYFTDSTRDSRFTLQTILQCFLIIMLVTTMSLVASPAWSGDGKGHYRHTPAEKLDKLTKRLKLTDDQRANILPILEDKQQRLEALHQEMKEVRQRAVSQIEAQLTPEQQEKFQKAREKRQEKMKQYRESRGKKGKKDLRGKHHKNGKRQHGDDHSGDDDSMDDESHDDEDGHADRDNGHGKKGKKNKRR